MIDHNIIFYELQHFEYYKNDYVRHYISKRYLLFVIEFFVLRLLT